MTKQDSEDEFDTLYEIAKDLLLKKRQSRNETIDELKALCDLMDISIKKHIIELMVDDVIKKRRTK